MTWQKQLWLLCTTRFFSLEKHQWVISPCLQEQEAPINLPQPVHSWGMEKGMPLPEEKIKSMPDSVQAAPAFSAEAEVMSLLFVSQ